MSLRAGWGPALAGVLLLVGLWVVHRLRAPMGVAADLAWSVWGQDLAYSVWQSVLGGLGWG